MLCHHSERKKYLNGLVCHSSHKGSHDDARFLFQGNRAFVLVRYRTFA